MPTNELLLKIATADPHTLARVADVLNHKDTATRTPDKDCRLVTFTDAAKRANVSRPTIYRLARSGRLRVVPLNGVNRILLSSLIDYINGNK